MFCIGSTRTERKYVKVIGNDIYNRVIKKHDKKYGELNTFMHIVFMTKETLDMWTWEFFQNKYGVIVSWEKVWNNYVQMHKAL